MSPILTILVAGIFPIRVRLCERPNPVGQPCGARVSNMKEHTHWHSLHDVTGQKKACFCHAGQHEYLKSVIAPSTLNCQVHTAKSRAAKERGKRMLAQGREFTENLRAV